MLFYFVVLLLLPLTEAVPSEVTSVMLSVVSGQAAIRVDWDEPDSNQPIIRYEVEYGVFDVQWIAIVTVQGADSLTTTITSLQRGMTYTVRVRAVSGAGVGAYTEPQRRPYRTIPSLPSEVTGVSLSVVSGQAAIRVNWNKPSSYLPVIRYEVEYGAVVWIAIVTVQGAFSLTTTITNLQRGTSYIVRVRAVSGAGAGNFTVPQRRPNLILPNLPTQVTGVSVSVVSGQAATIRVVWNEPSVDGTFVRYDIQHKTSSQSWAAVSSTEAVTVGNLNVVNIDLTNLQRGITYNVRVRAVSDAGNGDYSAETTYTVPSGHVPSQVNPPTVTKAVSSGRPALTVSWSVPDSDSPITKFEVEYRKTSDSSWLSRDVTSPPTTLSNLDAGTEYAVQVRAVSGIANGPFSTERRQTTFNVPSVVTGVMLSAVSVQATIRVNWNNQASVDGTFIRYDVQYRTSSQSWDASMTETIEDQNVVTVDLTNLQRGTIYNVRVRAVSDAGNGPYSTAATSNLQTIVPTEVTGVSLSVVAVEVSWNNRSVVGNFSRYEVEYKISYQSWDASTTETVVDENVVTVDLTNLQQGTTYNVRVRAVSDAGNGPYSAEATFTVPNVDEEAAFEISTSPLDSHVGVIVGVFVAGLVAGVLGLLLVIGIVFGACKLIKQPNKNGSKESGSDPNAVEMTQSPAYESVAKAYEDVDHPTQQRSVPKKINEEYAIIE